MADGSHLAHNAIPKRTLRPAAVQAAASFGAYLSSSDDSEAAEDGPGIRRRTNSRKVSGSIKISAKSGKTSRRNKSVTETGPSSVVEPPLPSPSASGDPPATRPRPQPPSPPSPKKALQYPKLDHDDDLSDLTSLSPSSSSSESSTRLINSPSPSPPPPAPSQSHRHLAPFPISLASDPPSPPMPVFSYHSHPEKWQLDTLGAYVWVLLDEKELHVFEPGQDERKERIWWPGKIDDSIQDAPLLVRIYGSDTTLKVHSPSERNILSYKDSLGYPRFLLPTFIPPPKFELDESIYASPRKKRKRDRGGIEARWSIAVVAMHAEKEAEQDSDHLPEVGEAFAYTHLQCISTSAVPPSTSASPSKNPKKGPRGKGNKRKFEGSEDERDDSGFSLHEEDQRIHDYEVDEELDIPGELTLARYTKGVTDYWPARIEAYLPPKSRKEKQGRYRVTYLDGKKKDIPRSWFFTMEEPGFQSCKLGKFDSTHDECINDTDDDEVPHLHRPHSPSPDPPSTDYTPSADEFQDLPLRVQFSYTKPILQAVLNERYTPARQKHTAFLAGGKARDSIARAAGRRGKMSVMEVGILQTLVSRWCLRDGVRASGIKEDEHELKLGNDSRKADTLEGDVDAEGDTDAEGEPDVDDHVMDLKTGEPAVSENGHTDTGAVREKETSPCDTEPAFFSSPPDFPPSSSFSPPVDTTEPSLPTLGSTSSFMTLGSVAATEPYTISEGMDDLGTIEEESEAGLVPPQKGCEGYEQLSGVEKVDYCLNILLPEAITQILLWRSGSRNSIQLLSDEEEEELHEKGEKLLEERDWVFDVLRIRELKGKSKTKVGKERKKTTPINLSGRPKRNMNTPDYRE